MHPSRTLPARRVPASRRALALATASLAALAATGCGSETGTAQAAAPAAAAQAGRAAPAGDASALAAPAAGALPPGAAGAAPTEPQARPAVRPGAPGATRAPSRPAPRAQPVQAVRAVRAAAAPAAPAKRGRLDFAPYTATFLGSAPADEQAGGVDIAPDGTVVVGGVVRSALGRRARAVAGGGPGTVVRLDRTGRRVLSVTSLPGAVEDLDVSPADGAIAVVGSFGVAVLTPDASRLRWRAAGCAGGGADSSTGRRVAVAENGAVASLCAKRVRVHSARGAVLGTSVVRHQSVDDVAISSRSRLVYTTGGDNIGNLRVPFVQAATTRGGIRWTAWGWNRSQVGGNTSDSFGKRVALGGDGRLYLLGEAHGGVTVFSRNAMSPGRGAPNVATDAYNTTYNTGSNALLYVARLDAATGRHLAGQLLLSRKKDGKGNSVAGQAIAADEAGRIVVAGASAAKVENRDAKTICGRRLPPYGGDVFVLQLSANLRARTLWTAIGGNGTAGGVAVRGGVAAAALTPTAPGALTCRALPGQARPARALSDRARDVHLTVWSAARP